MAKRISVNVSLTRQLNDFVGRLVDKGEYQSASEVIRDGLRLIAERDRQRRAAVRGLRGKIAEGMAAVRRGEVMDGEKFFRVLERERAGRRALRRKSA